MSAAEKEPLSDRLQQAYHALLENLQLGLDAADAQSETNLKKTGHALIDKMQQAGDLAEHEIDALKHEFQSDMKFIADRAAKEESALADGLSFEKAWLIDSLKSMSERLADKTQLAQHYFEQMAKESNNATQ